MEDSRISLLFREVVQTTTLAWHEFWPAASSPAALRVYVLVLIATILIGAALAAYRSKKKLTEIQNIALNMSFPGPNPAKEDSIEKRRKVLLENAERELCPFRSAMWRLLVTGFVVPTAIFLIGTVFYGWFDPAGFPFLDLTRGAPLRSADASTIAWFAINQFSHGAFFDVLEVFDINIAAVANNPKNWWFSGAVLLYRTMVSAFVVALVIALAQFVYVKDTFRRKIDAEIESFRQPIRHLDAA